MPRPKKPIASFSPGQASYVLQRALADMRLSPSDVHRYLAGMHDEIRELESRLASLRDAVVRPVRRIVLRRARRTRKTVVSAERKASQQLQGQYLGHMRQIPKRGRAKYQKIAKEAGRERAIRAMKKALGK